MIFSASARAALCVGLLCQLLLPSLHSWQVSGQEADFHQHGLEAVWASDNARSHKHHDEDCQVCPQLSKTRWGQAGTRQAVSSGYANPEPLIDSSSASASRSLADSRSPRGPPALS
ncbi:MAG: hypothetical protein HY549_10240 [Elusimicrobia bacterium]|nr:hypothetical protein [Elusimicrobiota bacterium]